MIGRDLQMLVHYYLWRHAAADSAPPPSVDDENIAKYSYGALQLLGLLSATGSVEKGYKFSITPKGRAFIEHVLKMPMPEVKWVMPEPDNIE